MSPIINNQAAWIPTEKARVEVGPGPVPNPKENEVVIEVAYAAINPADYKMQDQAYFNMPYPWILGHDVSGTIVQLGSSVTRFTIGQRVLAHATVLSHALLPTPHFNVSEVPDDIPLASAVVLPVATSTAATGLIKVLGLPFPRLEPKSTGKKVFIWGGSSSCGAAAIQLAVAAGYTVVTTAGIHNHDVVRSLGATHFFDHISPTVIQDVLSVLENGDVIFDAISVTYTQAICAEIAHNIGCNKFASLLPALPNDWNVEPVFAPGLVSLDVGDAVWRNFFPEALAKGTYLPKPDPEALEGGLERVQDGIDIVRKGVSAKKIVIEILKKA